MILLVSEKAKIPFYAGKDCFNPACEVADIRGKSFIKSFPHYYREITKEELALIDITKWEKVDVLQGKGLKEAIELLSETQKKDILESIRNLLSPKILKIVESVKPKLLPEMTLTELKSFAVENNIDIPYTLTKKDAVLAFIQEKHKVA